MTFENVQVYTYLNTRVLSRKMKGQNERRKYWNILFYFNIFIPPTPQTIEEGEFNVNLISHRRILNPTHVLNIRSGTGAKRWKKHNIVVQMPVGLNTES